jgi:hypothetical protein
MEGEVSQGSLPSLTTHSDLYTPGLRFAACLATAHPRLGTVRFSAGCSSWQSPLRPCFQLRDLHPLVDVTVTRRTEGLHITNLLPSSWA